MFVGSLCYILPSLIPWVPSALGYWLLATGYVHSVSVSLSVVGHLSIRPSISICLSVYTRNYTHIWSHIHNICTSTQPYLLQKEKKKQGKPSLSPPFNSPLPTNPPLSLSLFVFSLRIVVVLGRPSTHPIPPIN